MIHMTTETLCFLGLLTHQLTILAEMSQSRKTRVTPFDYMRERPYKLSLSIIGAIIGYIVLQQMGELTLITAYGVGYMANDSIDRVGKMTSMRIK